MGRFQWNSSRRDLLSILLLSIVITLPPAVNGEDAVSISIQPYVGLSITGALGTSYEIQYTEDLGDSNTWETVTNLSLVSSPSLWVDTTSPALRQRYYRALVITNIPMVRIPAGSFVMGDAFGGEISPGEIPVHSVHVSEFYIDQHLVTKALWDRVRLFNDGNGYGFENQGKARGENHPVHTIDWFDAVKWCNARSEMDGLTPCYYANSGLTAVYRVSKIAPYVNWTANGYRLPTEAEWEKAARGGVSGSRYPWGNTITHQNANYLSLASYDVYGDVSPTRGYHPNFKDGTSPYTSPVGYFAPNGYGLYDMAGNTWHWCWDWFGIYSATPQTDPRGPAGPNAAAERILRGGSWRSHIHHGIRCAARYQSKPDYQVVDEALAGSDDGFGFRCVRRP